ncbi:hypothetical protein [Polycladomyces abyssicola]|nr:hypothetical protein [Polycladomyces abyssicola]
MPDAAKALVRLAREDHAAGQAWNVPGEGGITGHQVIKYASKILGYEPKVVSVKKWMLRLLGIGDKTMREMVELYYLYDRPFLLDGQKYQTHRRYSANTFSSGSSTNVGLDEKSLN